MKKLSRILFPSRAMNQSKLTWREALESLRVMKSRFKVVILSLTDGLTKEWSISAHLFWKSCRCLAKRSGWLFLALYIKQARVCLQRYCAGDKPPSVLTPAVSLTRTGLPRIIPSFHREKIRRGDTAIIQFYMSLFSVSKLIPLAAKVHRSLFNSLTDPAPHESINEFSLEIRPLIKDLVKRYCPGVDRIPLFQGVRYSPTWKTVPSWSWYKNALRATKTKKGESLRKYSSKQSLFPCFFSELAVFGSITLFLREKREQWPSGCLWQPYTRYALDPKNGFITKWNQKWYESRIEPHILNTVVIGIPFVPGRLVSACTGDGKRRVFAIGNYVNQRLLYPLHQWLAAVLKCIPMDGTFDQTAPLDRLAGSSGVIHSIDLKSATDRWPLRIMFELIQALFGRAFASSSVNSALGCNLFNVAFVNKTDQKLISFVAGQPLGYYSSWPLFALSHHLVVWYAAEQEYPGVVFQKYAILGDDIVIADSAVAARYLKIIERLGVAVSAGKCLTSPTGACEFAKKFRLKKMTLDVSPLSMRVASETWAPMGWYAFVTSHKRPLRLSTMLRIAGLGFKASSRLYGSRKHGLHARRLIGMLCTSWVILPWEVRISVALGYWVKPETTGLVIFQLLEYFSPKDLITAPLEVYPLRMTMEFDEYTLLRSWMTQYLKYLKWYAELYTRPVTLDDFFDAPVYVRTWFAPKVDLSTFRFGLHFRIVDWYRKAAKRSIRVLSSSEITSEVV